MGILFGIVLCIAVVILFSVIGLSLSNKCGLASPSWEVKIYSVPDNIIRITDIKVHTPAKHTEMFDTDHKAYIELIRLLSKESTAGQDKEFAQREYLINNVVNIDKYQITSEHIEDIIRKINDIIRQKNSAYIMLCMHLKK